MNNTVHKNSFKKAAKIGSGLLILLSLFQLSFVSLAQASAPRFNIFTPYVHEQSANRDYFLLDVENDTKGTGFNSSVSADPGDILTFSVYYHNGVNNTVANNTMLRVAFPSGTGQTQTATAFLWADNAENATASNPLSQSVTMNLSQPVGLQVIDGSIQWFPNQTSPLTNNPASFLSGQTGSELFGSGLNVGDIEGCWEFSGFVNFQARVLQQPTPQPLNLNIAKYVRNVSAQYQLGLLTTSANALPGDTIRFSIQISNPDGAVNNVRTWDVLPAGLNFVPGSVTVDNSPASDVFVSSGINLGTISANQTKNITFDAVVAPLIGSQTFTNIAYVTGDGVPQKQASAQVVVSQQIPLPPAPLKKAVANQTAPNGTDISNEALPGDTLQYTMTYTNTTGQVLQNAQILDVLPSYTAFQDVSNNGNYDSSQNQITWNVGTIAAGSTVSVSYRVKVQTVPYTGFVIGNTALLKAQGINNVISNETRTTVILPVVKGRTVRAVTGSNSLVENIIYSLLISIGFSGLLYLGLKYSDVLRILKLKYVILKIKARETF